MRTISKESIVIGTVSVLFIALMGWLIWRSPAIAPEATVSDLSLLSNASSHMTGNPGAKVTMVEFGDFQCPACAQVYPNIKQIVDKYQSNPNFNFVFRNYPLPQHKNALPSAEAAEAAGAQGKYWEMNHMLYERQAEWDDAANPTDLFVSYAQIIGLDTAKFRAEIVAKKYADVITADLNDGNRAGVNATPTLYINGVKLMDYNPASLEAAVQKALEA